jgi:hypothetical protein
MEIEETQLFKEIKTVIDEGPKPVNYLYRCLFIIDDKKYEPLKTIALNLKRDYFNGFSDELFTTVAIPNGLWAKVIYPNLHILDIIVLKIPILETAEEVEEEAEIEEKRYTAIPVTQISPSLTGQNVQRMSIAALDTTGFSEIEFQLIDKGAEALSMVTTGGVWRRTKTYKAIQGILAKESERAKTLTGPAVETIDVLEGTNEADREHIYIPQGTKLIDVPAYIHRECGGVYSTGINAYYQNKGWYVYPLYDITRYPEVDKKVTILKVPKTRFTNIERTYREDGDILYILGTNDSDFIDETFIHSRNSGDGIRYGDSRKVLRDIVEKKDNKAIIERKEVNHEFIFKNKDDLPDYRKQLNVHLSNDYLTANPFVQTSKIAMANGAMYEIDWENSNPDLLKPGMLIRIIYLDKDTFKELYGVLSAVFSVTQLRTPGLTAKRHITITKLVIFCSSITTQELEYDEIDEGVIQSWEKYESQ